MRRVLTIVSLIGVLIGAIGIVATVFLLIGVKLFGVTKLIVAVMSSLIPAILILYGKTRENQIRIEAKPKVSSKFAGASIGGCYESVVIKNGSSLPIRIKGLYVLVKFPHKHKGRSAIFDFYNSIETLVWEGYIDGEHILDAGLFKNRRIEPLKQKEINLNKMLSNRLIQSTTPSLKGTWFSWRIIMVTDRGIFTNGENILIIRLLFPIGINALKNILKVIGEIQGYQVELIEVKEGQGFGITNTVKPL